MVINRSSAFLAGALVLAGSLAVAQGAQKAPPTEQYQRLPIPPGFQVLNNELEGPIYADAAGKTLYTWPFRALRAGESGDQIGKPMCGYEKRTENGGVLEPYPGGFTLPDVDQRPSCAEKYPPVFAAEEARNVGHWSVIKRPEGKRQWAYDGLPVYTSTEDKKPGDVLGGSKRGRGGGGARNPLGPPALVPPAFIVVQTVNGRMIATNKGESVYAWDKDKPGRSNCDERCLKLWKPVTAPLLAESDGEWSVIQRSPGVKQWAFRGQPLYLYGADLEGARGSVLGSDEPGWHNVFTQHVAALPNDFTLQDTPGGQVVGDRRGHTVYIYNCTEDVSDQFECDTPDSPQQYRMAVCGRGDPDKCLKTFPYVLVSRNARNESSLWTQMLIDPHTGHRAAPGQGDALRVWAYRERPVFTFSGDKEPGDFNADGWGEGEGGRNGYKSFMVRDPFFQRDL